MYKDFDKFFKETKKKKIPFKLFGKTEFLEPSLPADVFLKIARAKKDYNAESDIPESVVLDLAISIFSEKKIAEWSVKGLTSDQLVSMFEWAVSVYSDGAVDDKKNMRASSKKENQ